MKLSIFLLSAVSVFFAACSSPSPLEYALSQAGDNRPELESVLEHYKSDPEKLAAAEFLIENMPAHFSYRDSTIYNYYAIADELLKSDLPHTAIRDSLLNFKKHLYPDLERKPVSDIKLMSADYLIYTIDNAFKVWKESEWAQHIDFNEFCESLLPYKVAEYQPFDYWRDTLSDAFSQNLKTQLYDDEETNTTYRTVDIVRNEILSKVRRNGEYTDAGYPLLTASQMKNIAYGRCVDYVNLAVATYRSVGIPSYIDATPFYGRFRAGHTWDVVVFSNGGDMPSEWDLACEHGKRFFPAQRFPKVFRSTYAINRERVRYRNTSVLKYPFDLCVKDITPQYTKTSDIDIDIIGYNIFDRITKEGRKYGTFLTFITQRPSELSPTALSQCSNFIIFRLFHPRDFEIVRAMSTNITEYTLNVLKTLSSGTALGFGTAFKIPVIVNFDLANPMPESSSLQLDKIWY